MSKHLLTVMIGMICILAPWISLGSDFQQQQSTLYPFKQTVEIQEDFLDTVSVSGTIGSSRFTTINGTSSSQTGEANRPGIMRRDTSAVPGTHTTTFLGSGAGSFLSSTNHQIIWAVRLNTNDANTTVRIGSGESPTANPPNDGIYFEKLDADTNWFCITRSGGAQTRTDSTVPVNTSFTTLAYTRNSTGAQFRINDALVCSQSANVPTGVVRSLVNIVNSAAASKTIDLDYFQLRLTGISR